MEASTTLGYIVIFSLAGTAAREGVLWLGDYPGAVTTSPIAWANLVGCAVIGFLDSDRVLFPSGPEGAPAARPAAKKSLPLYIGLTTGFCGSLTSFSSLIRDCFLAVSNDLYLPPDSTPRARPAGYSFLACLSVLFLNLSIAFSAFQLGVHGSEGVGKLLTPTSARIHRARNSQKRPHKSIVGSFLLAGTAILLWALVIVLTAVPSDRIGSPSEPWRNLVASLAFSPLGALTRYGLSRALNPASPDFPRGTFAANTVGTLVLAITYGFYRRAREETVRIVLTGLIDGFCASLTTVSTLVLELRSLTTAKAYRYGLASVLAAFLLAVAVMGGVRWSIGWAV